MAKTYNIFTGTIRCNKKKNVTMPYRYNYGWGVFDIQQVDK